jgi:drug/metabolite transporter (DMT)-like permease
MADRAGASRSASAYEPQPPTGGPLPRALGTATRAQGIRLALVAAALWGLAPVASKGTLAGYSPQLISVLRLGVASIVLRVWGGRGTPWLPRERWSVVAGVALGTDFLLYNYGLGFTTAALAGLVINIEVVSTVLLALWLLGERLTTRRMVGSIVTLAGVLYVATEAVELADVMSRERAIGNGMIMLAGIAWSLYAVAQRRAPRHGNLYQLLAPIFVTAMLTTVPGLLLPSAWRNPGGARPTMMLLVLIGLCTLAVYLAYARSQELVDVSVLAIALATIPIFTVLFSRVVLGETISPRVITGGAVILAGVLIIATERAGPTPPS